MVIFIYLLFYLYLTFPSRSSKAAHKLSTLSILSSQEPCEVGLGWMAMIMVTITTTNPQHLRNKTKQLLTDQSNSGGGKTFWTNLRTCFQISYCKETECHY